MKDRLTEELMAIRACKELEPGSYCNLGLGTPQLCASFSPPGVYIQAENGALGYGPLMTADDWQQLDTDLVDAGGRFFTSAPGMSFFDMLTSFAMVRSGRLISILGGLQVSQKGDLAIHSVGEGDEYPQVGGSMDLAWGAKRVIVTMAHNTKDGKPKVVKELNLPITAHEAVDLIITDLAVIEVTPSGLLLKEFAADWTPQEIQDQTEAELTITDDVREIEI